MKRPRLRHVGPGSYETLDRRFRIERRSVLGPRGGKIPAWWIWRLDLGELSQEDGPHASLTSAAQAVMPHLHGVQRDFASRTGIVYLIHLERPFGHARHYLGYTSADSVTERLAAHRAGRGAKMLRYVNAVGIPYDVVRMWPGGRVRERQLKKQGGRARLCPVCRAERARPCQTGG